jgi:hypothetical protein
MMKTKLTLFVAIIAVALCGMGCALTNSLGWMANSFEYPDPNEKSLILKEQSRLHILGVKHTFPSGEYTPELKSDKGLFYRAPKPILFGGSGQKSSLSGNPMFGGIYIPNKSDEDQRHGFYMLPASPIEAGLKRLREQLEFKYDG